MNREGKDMEFVSTKKAPQAIGPYSQAVIHDGMLYSSGQIALTPEGVMREGDVAIQTRQVLENLKEVLSAAGATLEDVVKTTIFLKKMDDFKIVNEVYAEFFSDHKPARSTVAVDSLPLGALVEIECIAKVG